MCGRYTLESDMEFVQQRFKFAISDPDYKPRYNIAPTQDVLTVTKWGEAWPVHEVGSGAFLGQGPKDSYIYVAARFTLW